MSRRLADIPISDIHRFIADNFNPTFEYIQIYDNMLTDGLMCTFTRNGDPPRYVAVRLYADGEIDCMDSEIGTEAHRRAWADFLKSHDVEAGE